MWLLVATVTWSALAMLLGLALARIIKAAS